jgi:hypothetical protein
MPIIPFDPSSSFHVISRSSAFFIMTCHPISPAIIATRHPDSFPLARNPVPCNFPVARHPFGFRRIITWFWKWRIDDLRLACMGGNPMRHEAS